jgi:hypothetical protein
VSTLPSFGALAMSWELRNGIPYYYRVARRDRRVTKKYVGRGPAGDLSARLDAQARRERERVNAFFKTERARCEAADRATRDFEAVLDLLLSAALHAGGFHRYRSGPWRRRRHGRAAAEN